VPLTIAGFVRVPCCAGAAAGGGAPAPFVTWTMAALVSVDIVVPTAGTAAGAWPICAMLGNEPGAQRHEQSHAPPATIVPTPEAICPGAPTAGADAITAGAEATPCVAGGC